MTQTRTVAMQHAGEALGPAERFQALYQGCYQAIFAYVLRRIGEGSDDVPDVVAEVFVVAWRRRSSIPAPPEGRLWLYGVARRVLADHQRRASRQRRLESRIRDEATAVVGADRGEPARVREAVERLRPRDREVLRLVAWDGLSHTEAAVVLGCSANAVALRIHKARAQLKRELSSRVSADPAGGQSSGATAAPAARVDL